MIVEKILQAYRASTGIDAEAYDVAIANGVELTKHHSVKISWSGNAWFFSLNFELKLNFPILIGHK